MLSWLAILSFCIEQMFGRVPIFLSTLARTLQIIKGWLCCYQRHQPPWSSWPSSLRVVYVAKWRNFSIAKALNDSAQVELPWPKVYAAPYLGNTADRSSSTILAKHVFKEIETSTQNMEIEKRWYNSNLAKLFKYYSSDIGCYTGNVNDNFERKISLYLKLCKQNALYNDARLHWFTLRSVEMPVSSILKSYPTRLLVQTIL